MNTSTEHISQCNQSEPLADASGRIVDLINENGSPVVTPPSILFTYPKQKQDHIRHMYYYNSPF